MADGQAPDQTQALLQWQAQLNATGGGNGKTSPLLAGLGLRDADVFSGLSAKGKGLNGDGMINKLPQGKPKLADKMLQVVAGLGEDFKKAAQNAGVMYSGDLPNGNMPSSSGGSFASNVSSRSGGGGAEIG